MGKDAAGAHHALAMPGQSGATPCPAGHSARDRHGLPVAIAQLARLDVVAIGADLDPQGDIGQVRPAQHGELGVAIAEHRDPARVQVQSASPLAAKQAEFPESPRVGALAGWLRPASSPR
jgi:hypothetical protein